MSVLNPAASIHDRRMQGKAVIALMAGVNGLERDLLTQIMAENVTSAEQGVEYMAARYRRKFSPATLSALFAKTAPRVVGCLPGCSVLDKDLGSQRRLGFYFA